MTVRDLNNFYPVLRKRFWKQSLTVFLKQGFLLLKNKMEIWKEIKGYEVYQVSNLGNIKSFKNKKLPKLLKQGATEHGYLQIGLCNSGNKKTFRVHRLVGFMFVHNPMNKPCINHLNGDKKDNRVENLEWVTSSENIRHAFKTGLKNARCENNNNSILTMKEVIKIRELDNQKKYTQEALAKIFNCSRGCIRGVTEYKNWKGNQNE